MVSQSIFLTLALPVLVTLLRVLGVRGYIPAQPSNGTVQETGQINTSMLHLQWYRNGSDLEYVTQQPVGPEASNGPAQGILVHFTEDSAGNETTTTPWIAFVSCDANSTSSSSEVDVFTLAKDLGAKSAILYSLYSETCVINTGNQNSVLGVFTTQSLNASWHIEYEFGQFGPASEAYYGLFNATMLNDAAEVINSTITFGYPAAPGFLFATLPVFNTSNPAMPSGGIHGDANQTGPSISSTNSNSQDTGVAMIVLYIITGCVSALFCAVIVSGAVRAIRYPERYGPRAADPTLGGGQSRAGGLGRAILDTFPIVKFRPSANDRESIHPHHKDVESAPMEAESSAPVPSSSSVRLAQLSSTEGHDEHHHDPREGAAASSTSQGPRGGSMASEGTDQAGLPPHTTAAVHETSRISPSTREMDIRMPESIGRETCPICIVDFEEGDDLRVLPCEGKHRFHQSCVDPWLLELSGSCPICRQDFHALETIISGEPGSEAGPGNRNSESRAPARFSRYLRFARRRQRSRDQESPPPPES